MTTVSTTGADRLLNALDLPSGWTVAENDGESVTLNYTAVPRTRLARRSWPGIDVTHTGPIWMLLSHDSIGRGFDRDHAGIVAHGKSIDCTHFDDAVAAVEHALERVEQSVGEELRDAHKPRMLPDGGTSKSDTEQPFDEWLTEKLEEARERYKDGPRSENPRQSDISLGRLRAYRDARTEYLNREADTETDQQDGGSE